MLKANYYEIRGVNENRQGGDGNGSVRYVFFLMSHDHCLAASHLTFLPQTFLRRLEIADSHHLLQAHVPILQQLGVDGMSSDESDLEELERDPSVRQRRPRFFVRSPLWRKRDLSAWLRVFDAMHIYERRSSGINLRGAYPRYRVHKIDHFSRSKKFVSHLPLSAYNGKWLEDHEDPNFTVCPNHEETYDFTHHPDVHEWVFILFLYILISESVQFGRCDHHQCPRSHHALLLALQMPPCLVLENIPPMLATNHPHFKAH